MTETTKIIASDRSRNGSNIFRQIWWVTGGITGSIVLTGIITGILAQLYIFPVTATKESLDKLVTKEVFELTLKQFEQRLFDMKGEMTKTKEKVDKIYTLLLSIKRGGEM